MSNFQPKLLSCVFPLLENTAFVQNDFTLLQKSTEFVFSTKDQSNFSISTTTANPSATLVPNVHLPCTKG
jgi:hypothetical protein